MSVGLHEYSRAYKPFRYPWAYDAWKIQQQIHWMPEEVQLGEDIKDWRSKLTDGEREFLTAIFRFFTQADIDVNANYLETYSQIFKPNEVRMMLSAFANMETVHIAAYALLVETVGMPESEFGVFLEYDAMRRKHEESIALQAVHNDWDRLLNLAAFGGFIEGMQLYASFAMLMNFQRFGKMKGMGQIIEWSIRDESLHSASLIRLFREYRNELGMNNDPDLSHRIYDTAHKMVANELRFLDLVFDMGEPEGLSHEEMSTYVFFITNQRLNAMGYQPISDDDKHPLPWLEELIHGVEHANFFETRPTEYSKGALAGSWTETFSRFDGAS